MFHPRSRCGDRDEPSPKRIKTEVREHSVQLYEQGTEFYFSLSSFNDKYRGYANILYRRDVVHAGTVTHISTLKTTTEDRSGKEEFGLKMIQLAMLLSKITFSLEPVGIQWTSKNWTKIARTHSDLSALVSWHSLSEWIHSICKDVMENMWRLWTLQGFSGDERAEHLLT